MIFLEMGQGKKHESFLETLELIPMGANVIA